MRRVLVGCVAALAASTALLAGCLGPVIQHGRVTSTTVVETATANGYVSARHPATAYPLSTRLYVGAGETAYRTYLKFDLSDRAGALTGASLVLHTAGDTAGSAASQTVSVTSSRWLESTLTYRSARPARAQVGALAGPTQADATYSIPLDIAAVRRALGRTLSLVITQTAPDVLVLASRDTPTPPRLRLTFDGRPMPSDRRKAIAGPKPAEAAVRHGWGTPIAGDEFDYTGSPDEEKWSVYDSVGHAGHGRRSPAQVHVDGSVLRIDGDAEGTTGGMSQKFDQTYGKWEARMRVSPGRDVKYHPVMIVWPDQGRVLANGCAELDYAESTKNVHQVNFIVHHTCSGGAPARVRTTLDMTQWHNYAIYWSPGAIRGYIDGVQIFETTDPDQIPDDPAHQTIQLDWFPDGSSTRPTWMEVDWVRVYR